MPSGEVQSLLYFLRHDAIIYAIALVCRTGRIREKCDKWLKFPNREPGREISPNSAPIGAIQLRDWKCVFWVSSFKLICQFCMKKRCYTRQSFSPRWAYITIFRPRGWIPPIYIWDKRMRRKQEKERGISAGNTTSWCHNVFPRHSELSTQILATI